MEARIEAMARWAKSQNALDPVSYLENLLWTKIPEIMEAGKIIEVTEGGRTVRFAFTHNEEPGEVIVRAIRFLESELLTGRGAWKVHACDFSGIDL